MTRHDDPSGWTESEFLAHVTAIARDLGWGVTAKAWQRAEEEAAGYGVSQPPMAGLVYHTAYSIGSDAGWPDCVFIRRRDKRIVYAELKTARGRVSTRQAAVIDLLRAVGAEAHVWRPSDLAAIRECLA